MLRDGWERGENTKIKLAIFFFRDEDVSRFVGTADGSALWLIDDELSVVVVSHSEAVQTQKFKNVILVFSNTKVLIYRLQSLRSGRVRLKPCASMFLFHALSIDIEALIFRANVCGGR